MGGIGMSGLAELLLRMGHQVSGSDLSHNENIQKLESLGVGFFNEHSGENVAQFLPDVLVYSSAIRADNPERAWAVNNKIPVIQRAEMLAEIMRYKRGVAIAGSHGKTTTTAMCSWLLKENAFDPTVVIGGRFDSIGSNVSLGKGAWIIAESDESDGTLLRLAPEYSILTNVDQEHLDHYGSFEKLKETFSIFLNKIPFYGKAIVCSDDPHIRELTSQFNKPMLSYGFEKEHKPDFLIEIIELAKESRWNIALAKENYERKLGPFLLNYPGRHNVLNATAAIALATELGLKADNLYKALESFAGVQRRFQRHGTWNKYNIIEDYAHHPKEIKNIIEAVSLSDGKKPVVLFQPHRYSRMRDLWPDFTSCFDEAREVFSLPVYRASEKEEDWQKDFSSERFAQATNIKNTYAESFSELLQLLKSRSSDSETLLILGAGDIGRQMLKRMGL